MNGHTRALVHIVRRGLLTAPALQPYTRPDPDGEPDPCGLTDADAVATAEHLLAMLAENGLRLVEDLEAAVAMELQAGRTGA